MCRAERHGTATAEAEIRLRRPVRPGRALALGRAGDVTVELWDAGAALVGPGGELCAAGLQRAAVATWGVPLSRTREAIEGTARP